MKKILILFSILLSCLLMSSNVKAEGTCTKDEIKPDARIMYAKRDTILRNKYSKEYSPNSILTDGVKIAVIKGTPVEILSEIKDKNNNVIYYQVNILKDCVFYLSNRKGYINAKSLTTDYVERDNVKDRTLTVSDKTTLLLNVITILNVSILSDGKINILYPTHNAIEKELGITVDQNNLLASKDVLRSAGFNFIINNVPFTSKRTKVNNGNNYYLSCSGFTGVIYYGTFGYDVFRENADGTQSLYWVGGYKRDVTTEQNPTFRTIKCITTLNNNKCTKVEKGQTAKLGTTKEMQIGDSIFGTVNSNNKPENSEYYYDTPSGHIMLYIGDALIAHATSKGIVLNYVDYKKGGVNNYFITLGERTIKEKTIENGKEVVNTISNGYRFDKELYLIRPIRGIPKGRYRLVIDESKDHFNRIDLIEKIENLGERNVRVERAS